VVHVRVIHQEVTITHSIAVTVSAAVTTCIPGKRCCDGTITVSGAVKMLQPPTNNTADLSDKLLFDLEHTQ
jgi:hypothetical protein